MTTSTVSQSDVAAVAADAFVFGYPLVLMDREMAWMTAVAAPVPERMKAPVNRFVHARVPPEATDGAVAVPHADTLRSSAWLDLGEDEPVLLTVPETRGRYYVLSLIDLWTNVFTCIGARTTGTRSGTFAIVGPRSPGGPLPSGAVAIGATTRIVRIAGLTKIDGHGRDAEAHAVQDGFVLAPLSTTGSGRRAGAPAGLRHADRTPPVSQIEQMDAMTFFGELSRLMRDNPPRLEDRVIVERMREVGLAPDASGSQTVQAHLKPAVEQGVLRGAERVVEASESLPGEAVGDWRVRFRLGQFGTDYVSRAGAACAGLEAGPAADELPALLRTDTLGRQLTGRHRYVLRFAPGAAPPVRGLWTLTTYDDRQSLVDNPADRYSIGDWNGLTLDPDGSLTIHIQHARPADDTVANWLPVPPGSFNVLLRLIWPEDEVLDRRWAPPAVARVS